MHDQNEAQLKPFTPFIQMVGDTPIFVKSEDGDYEVLEEYLNKPTRARLKESVRVFQSFLETIKDRLDPESATVYTKYYIGRKFDNFDFKAIAHDCRTGADWRGDFTFNWDHGFTKDCKDWIENDESPLQQEEFALFLDKHLHNVIHDEETMRMGLPSQMEIYNFVTTLEDSNNSKFTRKVNTQNGNVSISLEKIVDDQTTQRLKFHERFMIAIQPFEGFPTYKAMVKLRFRIRDGQVIFFYDIEGLEEIFIAARNWAAEQIREQTGIRVCL